MFKKNMKKALALLASLLILCTLIPLSSLISAIASDENIVVNGDFESGTDSWTMASTATLVGDDTHGGSGALKLENPSAWGEAAIQVVSVDANSEYKITWYSKRVSGNGTFNLFIMNNNGYANLEREGNNWMNETSGNWVKNECVVQTGSATAVLLKFSCEVANAGVILLDDLTMVKVGGEDPAPSTGDNMLVNGDFETGDITGWENVWGSCTVSTVSDAHDGNWAMSVGANQWQIVRQKVAVEANTDYIVTVWYKDVNKTSLLIKDGGDTTNVQQMSLGDGSSSWKQATLEFNSGSYTSVYVCLMGNENGAKGIYDDAVMVSKNASQPDEPTGDNLLGNGDFEAGEIDPWDNLWGSNTVTLVDGRNGGTAMNVISGQWKHVRQIVSVEKNTDYVITGWYKNVTDMLLLVKDGADTTNMTSAGMNGGSDWTQVTLEVNSGNNDKLIVTLMGNVADSKGTFDDFQMVKKDAGGDDPVEPVTGIVNGDFETGDSTGWETHQSTVIEAAAAHDGSYGAHLIGNGGWGGLLNQAVPAEAGKSYEVSFWFKVNTTGINVQIKDGSAAGAQLDGSWFDANSATEWTKKTFTVTPTTDAIFVNFCGSGSAPEDVYVDDVTVTELKEASFDGYITNGDFETGQIDGWENLWGSCDVEIVGGRNGGSAVKISCGQYNIFRQVINVEANTDYVVHAYAKGATNMSLISKSCPADQNMAQTTFASGSDWTLTTFEFNSGDNTQIYLAIMGNGASATGIFDDIKMYKKGEEPDPDDPDTPIGSAELVNGDFENGDEGWTLNNYASIVSDDTHKGNGALKLDNPTAWAEVALQTVSVEKDTNYVITWYAKRVEGSKAFNLILMNGSNVNYSCDGQNWMNETSGDWIKYEITVSTGSNNVIKFKFTSESTGAGIVLIDDIAIVKEGEEPEPEDGNLIKNGSFENGKDDWTWKGNTVLSEDAFIGEASAKLDYDTAYGEALTQVVKIQPNTDYVLIWHTRRVSGSGAWDLFLMDYDTINITNMNVDCDGQKWFQQTDKEWQESRIYFNSGETTKLFIKFGPESANSGIFLLDEVALYVKGTEPVDPIVPDTPPKTSMYLTSYGVDKNRPMSAEDNLLNNASFENAKGGQWQDGFTGDTISIVDDDTTKFGDKSLYFNTAGIEEQTKLIFWLDLEADTSYVFSTWLKGKYLSDDNCGDATIGIVDDGGTYLEMSGYSILNGERQIVPTAWDDEWHLRSVEFNTGSATKVGIAISGVNSQMYIDDMALFVVGKGTKYVSENMGGTVSLSYSIDYYACEEEDSLIPDPNFNTKDKSGFWADSYGWRNGVLSFVDNKYEYGTSMKYTASGNQAALSTIKWVELEQDTQYVFVVDLKILEDGFGKLVLFDDKLKDKINFLEISFDSYDYDEANSTDGWYTVASCFNTGVYERVGIAIVDDGGEVLLDNMRLFKKSDGADVVDKFIPLPTTTTTTEPTEETTETTETTEATVEPTETPTEDYPEEYYPEEYYPTDSYYPVDTPTETEPVAEPTDVITEPSEEPSEAPAETDPGTEDNDVFSTVMLWVGIGAGIAAVLAGICVLVIVLIKKRKKAETPEE